MRELQGDQKNFSLQVLLKEISILRKESTQSVNGGINMINVNVITERILRAMEKHSKKVSK